MKHLTILFTIIIASTQPAYAYLDPGTGSILLQAIIGGIAAMMMFGRGALANVKEYFSKGNNDVASHDSDLEDHE